MPTSEKPSITFPVATTLDIGLNLMEDRLILAARPHGRERRLALVTRRMLDVLLAHTVKILEQTTPSAARVPEEYRNEVLQMEHIGALTARAREPLNRRLPSWAVARNPTTRQRLSW